MTSALQCEAAGGDVEGDSRVDLLAAAVAGHGDEGPQPLRGVLHELALQSALPGHLRPGELLVQVEQAVERQGQRDETPAHRAPHLPPSS